jgi:pimeloyl-ACP methyl ester carboxylesterase
MLRRLVLAAMAASVLISCGPRESNRSVVAPIDRTWIECGDVECADFVVPLNRGAVFSEDLVLKAYRSMSPVATSRHLPLIIHPGGPGSDVRAAVSRARELLAPIIDDFDVYALSTRGAVDGTPFDCGDSLDDVRVVDTDTNAVQRFAERCLEESASLTGNVGTRQSVEDLEQFRAAIGVDKVRFLGWSYGATLGAAWAMTYPASIRSIVLDAPSDPRVPWSGVVREKYDVASRVWAERASDPISGSDMNERERALAREYLLYEPMAVDDAETLAALRLGETSDGRNDGGIETQIGVHCADVIHAEARAAIAVRESSPTIGFGSVFDRVCLELPESTTPLSQLIPDDAATRVNAMVISAMGDHVMPANVSRDLAREMSWKYVAVDLQRHLTVGFDARATKTAMAFLATGH